MTSTTSFFNFPYGFFQQQQQLSHSKSDEFLEDDSPASLSRSPSSSSIDYPLDSESSSSSLRISHKLDSVVAPPPLMAHPFASTHIPSDTTSNTVSPTGSPVHPSAVQVKRKRGRPPKPKTSEDGHESSSSQDGVTSVAPASPPKRKRGRPPGKKKKSEQEFVYYLDESTGSVTPTASRQEQDDKDYSDDGSPKNVPFTFPTNAFGLQMQMQMQMSPQQPIKRGRGRPRKYPAPTPQNVQSKPLPLSTSLDWMDSFDQDLTPFTFEPPSDYAIVDYLRSIVNEQSKSLLGYTEVRGLLECHFGMDLQYRQYYIEESLDLLCPYS